jgi:putative transposase
LPEYINDEVVVKEAIDRLQRYLPINWDGNRYNPMDAWTVLIGAAAMESSVASTCREGEDAPNDNTLREQLNAQGWNDNLIEAAFNQLLARSYFQCSWPARYPVVIDLHEEPFYGKPPEDDPEVIRRGEAKSGTTHFHVFATAYVVRKNRRFTLAVTRVRAHESMLEVANRLRERVEGLGIEVLVYLLDRQFWCYELQAAWKEVPYIIAVRRTGKPGTGGGTRPLFDLKESQFVNYTMTSQTHETLSIEVAVVVLPETREERKKRIAKAKEAYHKAQQKVEEKAKLVEENPNAKNKRALTYASTAEAKALERLEKERAARPMTTLCYAINKVEHWSLNRIYESYRSRFGIESSYRQSREARIMTTSRKPWFRFLRFGLSMVLRNLWIEIRWFLAEPKRGRAGRKVSNVLLPFPMFLRWIVSAVWKLFHFKTKLFPQTELPNPLWGIP